MIAIADAHLSSVGDDRPLGRTPARSPLAGHSVLLAHDYLLVMRGAERTFLAMADLFGDAAIATLLHDEEAFAGAFGDREVRTSFLRATGVRQRNFRALLPILPLAAERLAGEEFDVVISSSSAFAHGVRARPGGVHVCYCHSPFRYAYFERDRGLAEAPFPLRPGLAVALGLTRRWTTRAAARVTHFVANSRLTQRRIKEAWGRHADIVHPPVDVERFYSKEPEDFLLLVGELTRHKRPDVALEAARLARMPIVVVGDGPEMQRLSARYGDMATFAGRLEDMDLTELYARAMAFVVPNVEEFGIAAVEAQAAGRPVIAINGGGVQETVVHGETGLLVNDESPEGLAAAFRRLPGMGFDCDHIQSWAQRFSRERFQRELLAYVEAAVGEEPAEVVTDMVSA
jgi:glycosyltransferase involved in cell wall biosynthesis